MKRRRIAAQSDRVPAAQCAEARTPTMMGNRYIFSVRTPEILDKLEMHPSGGSARRKSPAAVPAASCRYRRRLRRQGYGSGGDCSLGRVELSADGKILIHGDHVEMGNGVGTALATVWRCISGGIADEVCVADRQLRCAGAGHVR